MVSCRAMWVHRHGSEAVLGLAPLEVPEPGPGEILIRVRAAGLNFADVYARMGLYEAAPPPPFVPGFEVAGTVESLGAGGDHRATQPGSRRKRTASERDEDRAPGRTALAVGDRVIGVTRFGGWAELVRVPGWACRPMPVGATFEEGAGFPAVFMTAWHGLVTLGHVRDGMTVLVHAAAGGVGTAALQLLAGYDVEVFATAGSPAKLELARSLGADLAIDYRTEDFEAILRERTGGRGVDLVLDSVGGACFRKSYRLLAKMGHLVTLGAATMMPASSRPGWLRLAWQYLTRPRLDPLAMIGENRTVSGFNLVHLFDEVAYASRCLDELLALWEAGRVKPLVTRTWPLERAGEAQEALRTRATTGKVVLTLP